MFYDEFEMLSVSAISTDNKKPPSANADILAKSRFYQDLWNQK